MYGIYIYANIWGILMGSMLPYICRYITTGGVPSICSDPGDLPPRHRATASVPPLVCVRSRCPRGRSNGSACVHHPDLRCRHAAGRPEAVPKPWRFGTGWSGKIRGNEWKIGETYGEIYGKISSGKPTKSDWTWPLSSLIYPATKWPFSIAMWVFQRVRGNDQRMGKSGKYGIWKRWIVNDSYNHRKTNGKKQQKSLTQWMDRKVKKRRTKTRQVKLDGWNKKQKTVGLIYK